jgi:hypothetical protein
MGQKCLPLKVAPLKPSFRHHVYDSHRLFLNYTDILKITPLLLFPFIAPELQGNLENETLVAVFIFRNKGPNWLEKLCWKIQA